MPVFGTASPPTLVAGYPAVVWNAETVPTTPAGSSVSQSVAMKRNGNMPNCVSVELGFATNPGAFAVEVQFADTNEDKYFVTRTPSYTSGLSAGFAGRIEYTNIVAKFARLKMVTLTNAVAVTAKFY